MTLRNEVVDLAMRARHLDAFIGGDRSRITVDGRPATDDEIALLGSMTADEVAYQTRSEREMNYHFVTLVRPHLEAGATPTEAVAAVCADLSREEVVELADPLFVAAATHELRNLNRDVEHEVAELLAGATTPEDRVAARRALVGRSFPVEGKWVAWYDATPADHRLRAQWQRRHAGACIADADLHEEAADEIEAAGVTCLRDLDDRAGEAA